MTALHALAVNLATAGAGAAIERELRCLAELEGPMTRSEAHHLAETRSDLSDCMALLERGRLYDASETYDRLQRLQGRAPICLGLPQFDLSDTLAPLEFMDDEICA